MFTSRSAMFLDDTSRCIKTSVKWSPTLYLIRDDAFDTWDAYHPAFPHIVIYFFLILCGQFISLVWQSEWKSNKLDVLEYMTMNGKLTGPAGWGWIKSVTVAGKKNLSVQMLQHKIKTYSISFFWFLWPWFICRLVDRFSVKRATPKGCNKDYALQATLMQRWYIGQSCKHFWSPKWVWLLIPIGHF